MKKYSNFNSKSIKLKIYLFRIRKNDYFFKNSSYEVFFEENTEVVFVYFSAESPAALA